MDYLNKFRSNIFNTLVGTDFCPHFSLVQPNKKNLYKLGDFFFPINVTIWNNHINCTCKQCHDKEKVLYQAVYQPISNLNAFEASIKLLTFSSQKWDIPIKEVRIIEEKCQVFLDRYKTTRVLLQNILKTESYGFIFNRNKEHIYFIENDNNDKSLTCYRRDILKNFLRKILKLAEFEVVSELVIETTLKLKVVSCIEKKNDLAIFITCGNVTGSEAVVTYDKFISLRSEDMRLLSMHKYGLRSKNETKFCDLMNRLGRAAVTVDLLEIKHSSPIIIQKRHQGCSRGASFILYNSARIETLIKNFDDHVRTGYYPGLPDISEVDFSLLKEEEEWELIFLYILHFPNIIRNSITGIEVGKCAPHLLLQFLSGLVRLFSIYYRKCRILKINREHLIPTIHARMYLVLCIRKIINTILALFDIQPVEYM